MKKEILVSVYDTGEVDYLPKITALMKRYRALEFILFKANFAGYGEIGDALTEIYDETILQMKRLISKSNVELFELDSKGKKIKYNLKNTKDEGEEN